MKTSQLLGELLGNILRDTSHAVSPASQLWTPESLVTYLNEGQDKFAEETLSIVDGTTPEATEITLVAGESVYELHEKVLTVLSARVGHRRTGRRLKDVTGYSVEDGSDRGAMSVPRMWFSSPGRVQAFSLSEEPGHIRIYPEPSDDMDGTTLYLRVARLPMQPLVVPVDGEPDTDLSPGIPPRYHLDLCDWAAYRALRNHDTDAENIPKASTHRNQFERAVAKAAKRARQHRMLPATFGGRVNN